MSKSGDFDPYFMPQGGDFDPNFFLKSQNPQPRPLGQNIDRCIIYLLFHNINFNKLFKTWSDLRIEAADEQVKSES